MASGSDFERRYFGQKTNSSGAIGSVSFGGGKDRKIDEQIDKEAEQQREKETKGQTE